MEKTIFINVSLPELLEEVDKIVQLAVQNAIKLMSANMKKHQEPIYLSRQEVCDKLGISYPTLHRHVNSGLFSCMKVGRRSYFDEKQIENAMVKLNAKGGNYGF